MVRTRITLYILSSAALFTWFLYLDERDTFTFRWFIDYPGIYLVIAIYALPVIAFQFLAERFLLHSERSRRKRFYLSFWA